MLIGAHVSNAGGLPKAVERGVERGCEAIQIFNQSPRMWRPTAYSDDDFAEFREAIKPTKIKAVLIHAVYLLNCATEDREMRDKSRTSLIQSLRVGAGIRAVGVVLHPGSAKQGDVGKAIKRAGKVIKEALDETERCHLLLEDTAGAGGTLGRSFEELAALIDASGGGDRLGICLDSCHLLASGYEVRTVEGLRDTLKDFDSIVGRKRLSSLHVNDSMTPLGSNREGVCDVLVRAPVPEAAVRARNWLRRRRARRQRRRARGQAAQARPGVTRALQVRLQAARLQIRRQALASLPR